MAWEWVAPAVTGLVGVAGTTGTVVVAWLGRRHAEEVARTNAHASIFSAREARITEFLIEATETITRRTFSIANRSASLIDFPRGIFEDAQQQRMSTKLEIFGSPALSYVHLKHLLTSAQLIIMMKTKDADTDRYDVLFSELVELDKAFSSLVKKILERGPFDPPLDHEKEIKTIAAKVRVSAQNRDPRKRTE